MDTATRRFLIDCVLSVTYAAAICGAAVIPSYWLVAMSVLTVVAAVIGWREVTPTCSRWLYPFTLAFLAVMFGDGLLVHIHLVAQAVWLALFAIVVFVFKRNCHFYWGF